MLCCGSTADLRGHQLLSCVNTQFSVISSKHPVEVQKSAIKGSALDNHLPPVEIDKYDCNCCTSTSYCVVAMNCNTSPRPMKPLANCLVLSRKKAIACCEDRRVFCSVQGHTKGHEGMFSSINVV